MQNTPAQAAATPAFSVDHTLDARGLVCPLPLLKTKHCLLQLEVGQVLHILAEDTGAWTDIPAFVRHSQQHTLLDAQQTATGYHFWIRKGESSFSGSV